MKSERINTLYEQIIHLDEIAGQLDPESNACIDAERVALKQQIYINELLFKHNMGNNDWLSCEDIAALYNIDLEAIHAEVEHCWTKVTA